MSFYRFRLKNALKGSSNYIAWKDRMEVVLEENELKEFINKDIPKQLKKKNSHKVVPMTGSLMAKNIFLIPPCRSYWLIPAYIISG